MRIGYARVSTDEQNLALQLDALRDAGCERIFQDDGVSAVARCRPQFSAALEALQPGDTLVIWKMDRAFRSLLHALQTLEYFDSRNLHFQSLTDAIDTHTAMGRFAYQIINAFGELERALIAERTKAGIAAAKRRGVRIGRPPKLSAEQIAHARMQLCAHPEDLKAVAHALHVSPRTLARTIGRRDLP